MIKSYLKSAWRNIVNNKGIFTINIGGLAIGIASCIIISLFVFDELSYDRFNKNASEIVRVVFKANINGEDIKEAVIMPPVAKTLEREFPEVLKGTRLRKINNASLNYNNNSYRNLQFAYVDPNFFSIFSLPIIKGDKTNPLSQPNTIVITQKEAHTYFGNNDPIGKVLEIDEISFTVTAVMADIPLNSHFHFKIFASMLSYKNATNTSWMDSGYHSYLLLKKGTKRQDLETKLPAIVKKYMGPQMQEEVGMSFSEFTKKGKLGLFLQPLTDIHLKSDFSTASTLEKGGNMQSVYIFAALALFMLLIACINFMNLSTASSTKRAKEVGVRKALGAHKNQLIHQFLSESFIATAIALVIALLLVSLMLPLFNSLTSKELQISFLLNPTIITALLALLFGISFLAGWYPAFYISSFNPIAALKNKFIPKGKSKGIRSALVIFQFVISVGLITGTLIVQQQLSYIQNKNIGYNKEQLLVIRNADLLDTKKDAFKNAIAANANVSHITTSAFVPAGNSDSNMTGIYINHTFDRRTHIYNIDEQYIPTMGMEIIKGRNFSKDFGADSLNVIINETVSKKLGFGEQPLNKTITIHIGNVEQNLNVIGVVKDFHFRSLRQEIDPLIMLNNPYGGLIVRANVAEMGQLITTIENLWNSYNTSEVFSYELLDQSYNAIYIEENKMSMVVLIFALLTIFVACLGLFGLVTFTAEQRVKEIGIRKVLGSSVSQIISMLSKDFIKLVCISFFIAFPLAYFIMDYWLSGFAYRIKMQWWIFIVAALITVVIAYVTIGWKSYKAATKNPVLALRPD